jgi:hypothetical protein
MGTFSANNQCFTDLASNKMVCSKDITECSYLCSSFGFAPFIDRIIRGELQANAVDTMSLVCRCWIPLPLEDMTKVTTTISADDLRPLHPECAVGVSGDRAWDGIVVRWPAASRLEFVVRFVEWRVATGAGVRARLGHVLVVFASTGRLSAFLPEHSELLCDQKLAQLTW